MREVILWEYPTKIPLPELLDKVIIPGMRMEDAWNTIQGLWQAILSQGFAIIKTARGHYIFSPSHGQKQHILFASNSGNNIYIQNQWLLLGLIVHFILLRNIFVSCKAE